MTGDVSCSNTHLSLMAIAKKLSDCYHIETHLNYDLIFKVW